MGKAALLAWLVALPAQRDGHGMPIPRPAHFLAVVATVSLEHTELDDPRVLAAALDVLASHESGYRTGARGDSGRSCGAWQTPCTETPMSGDRLGLEQARVAARWVLWSSTRCPDHPLSLYATGTICGHVRIADFYWREVRAELAVPLEAP